MTACDFWLETLKHQLGQPLRLICLHNVTRHAPRWQKLAAMTRNNLAEGHMHVRRVPWVLRRTNLRTDWHHHTDSRTLFTAGTFTYVMQHRMAYLRLRLMRLAPMPMHGSLTPRVKLPLRFNARPRIRLVLVTKAQPVMVIFPFM